MYIGKCKSCGFQAGVLGLENGICHSCIDKGGEIKIDEKPITKILINKTSLTDKAIKYIGLITGVLLTFILLLINEEPFRYGLFTSEIKYTWLYDFLRRDIIGGYGSGAKNLAYFLWYLCLSVGILLSWKFRIKVSNLISKILTKIHKEI